MNPKQRSRGRILTPDGLSRLQQAIRAWELEHEVRCTQERIKELTSAVKEGGLDPGTIRKILKTKEGVDPESIRCLFTTFGLQLAETDLVSSSRLQIQADPNFVGREGAIADLNALVNRGAKVIVIQARGGVGKTTLARKYLQQEFGSFLEFPIAKETKDIASIESLIEEKLRQLGEEPGREFFVSLDRLKRKLQDERIGILIDNLEPALDSAGKFIEPHRRYVELLRVLTAPAVQSVTFITSRERLRESSVTVEHYMLRSLDIEAWEQFFQSRNLATDTSTFAALHNAYGGNAKAMDIIRGAILEDYSGDIAAYWQANQHDLFIERDLEDLVTQQFDRLQQIDADAYNLLCRMGCYRYQDVPTVPIEGLLCLLWDVPEKRQRRVVKSLQDRSLVEFEDGEYWLHPVIREEAINNLRNSTDWKIANCTVAEFLIESIKAIENVKDALQAFEAYYHYIELNNFEQASKVILKTRPSGEEGYQPHLGSLFYRLGLPNQMISAITQVIVHIEPSYDLSRLYNLLGDQYWSVGQISRALDFHQKSREVAIQILQSTSQDVQPITKLKSLESLSSYNRGFCKIDLWELDDAKESLEEYISFNDSTNHACNEAAYACLAFINSQTGYSKEAINLIEKIIPDLLRLSDNSWGMVISMVFLGLSFKNLNELEKSFEILSKAINLSKNNNFNQARVKALNGLAALYREQDNFNLAVEKNLEALDLASKVGAKCDLAETYYQLGLTYQAIGEVEKSDQHFQRAIRLFTEMEAPKQMERVRRSMLTDTIK